MILAIPVVPPSLNRVLRMHWTHKRDLLSHWVLEIRAAMGPPKPAPKVKMRVVITLHNSRQYDKDNALGACKVIFDAMKILRLIYDDRAEFLESEVRQEKSSRSNEFTVIELEAA